MVKLRNAAYCNLKLLLIFFVVYGHLIEPQIDGNSFLIMQYRWIYLVHMPLFAFLSGLFLDSSRACRKQMTHYLSLYFFWQFAAVFLGDGKVELFTPYWHLWYLLSAAYWCGIAWIWLRFGKGKGAWLLASSIVVGCLVSCISAIDREYSLSRTIVFFPYFLSGIVCDPVTAWRKYRVWSFIGVILTLSVMLLCDEELSTSLLYHAAPYGVRGIFLRAVCYLMGFSMGLFLLAWIPNVRFPFTRVGGNTLTAYLAHAPAVLWLRQFNLNWFWLMMLTALFLYLIHKLTQWNATFYGIR